MFLLDNVCMHERVYESGSFARGVGEKKKKKRNEDWEGILI